jgi:predicted RND superfamily exporter protein
LKKYLIKFNEFLQNAQNNVLEHHKVFFYLIPLVFLVLAFNTKPPQFASSLDSLLNKKSENYHNLKTFNKNFKIAPELFVNFKSQSVWNEATLCKLRKKIDEIKNIKTVFDVESAFDLREQKKIVKAGELDRVFFNRIVELNCHTGGALVNPLENLQKGKFNNLFTDDSGKSFSFIIFSTLSPDELGPEPYLMEVSKIKKVLYDIAEELNLEVELFGNIPYQYSLLEGLNENFKYNLLVLVILGTLFFLFFKTWKVSLIYFSTLIISSCFLFMLYSLTGSPIDVLNNSLFLFLALTTLSDYVFILLDSSKSFLKSFNRLIFPCFLTSFTTVIGFFSLMSSGQEITYRFGLMTGLCALLEWAILFFWAPCMIKSFNLERPVRKSFFREKLKGLMSFTPPFSLCLAFLSFFILFPFTFQYINFNEKPLELFDDSFQIVKDLKSFSEKRGFVAFTSFVTVQDRFTEDMKKQVSNLEELKTIEWATDIRDGLKGDFSESSFTNILGPIQSESWYERRFFQKLQHNHLFLKTFDIDTVYDLDRDIKTICPNNECYLAGESYAYAKFAGKIPKLFFNSSLLSITLVGLFVLIFSTLANNRFSGSYLFSVFFGVVSLFIFLGISQIEINFVTAGVVSILVGLTGDNAIHFASVQIIDGKSLDEALSERAKASLISTIIMLCLCCVFFLFKFNPPKYFGLTLLVGLSFNIWGDYWILKGLSRKMK